MMHTGSSDGRTRLWLYWGLGIITTLVFLLFITTIEMVPGISQSGKVWMLSAVGVAAITALGIGSWKFSSTEAPAMLWPLGSVMAVLLLMEVLLCIIGVFALTVGMHD